MSLDMVGRPVLAPRPLPPLPLFPLVLPLPPVFPLVDCEDCVELVKDSSWVSPSMVVSRYLSNSIAATVAVVVGLAGVHNAVNFFP